MAPTSSPCDRCGAWRHPQLRRDAVPEAGRPFFELAERIGVFDDGFEEVAVNSLSENDRQALAFFRANFPLEIDQWLCGDEARAASPSTEYMAFACLYFAADFMVRHVAPCPTNVRHPSDAKRYEWHRTVHELHLS